MGAVAPSPPEEPVAASAPRPHWRRRAIAAAVAVLAAGALRLTLLAPKGVPVSVIRVGKGRVEETAANSKAGTVKTRRRALLSPEVGGRVAELPVAKGSVVPAGTLLLRVADADYRAQVAVAERAAEAARASLTEAERAEAQAALDLSRYEKLEAERIASRELVGQLRTKRDMAAAAHDAARARLLQALSSLDAARAALAKTELRAPFGGVVAELPTEIGEWITPSPPGIPIPTVIQLLDPAAIYVSAPMDEVDVARVAVGLLARVGIDAYPGKTFAAKVTRVAPYVSDVKEQNRTFEIEVELEDAAFARTLRPGTSADVEVILAAKDGVLRVPSDALLEGPRVLVVKDGRLASLPVKTGLKNWAFAEVVSGLSEGAPVVVSLDRVEVKEGARARIEP